MGMDTWPLDYDYPVELNRYVYAAANPVTWSDPSGLFIRQAASYIKSALAAPGLKTFGWTTKVSFTRVLAYIYRSTPALTGAVCFIVGFASDADTGSACDGPLDEFGKGVRRFIAGASNPLYQAVKTIRRSARATSVSQLKRNHSVGRLTIWNGGASETVEIYAISGTRSAETNSAAKHVLRDAGGAHYQIATADQQNILTPLAPFPGAGGYNDTHAEFKVMNYTLGVFGE